MNLLGYTVMVKKLIRKRLGEIPLLLTMIERLRFTEVLSHYVKTHGNEKVLAVDTLLLMVLNIACGRQPLYELSQWVKDLESRALKDLIPDGEALEFSDDRFARALDKLFDADRASLVVDIALRVVEATGVDLSQIHNDSTTLKSTGQMPGMSATGVKFKHGHSKDHRPDLKQIVFNLTISADGAIPLHYKTYSGNRTDDTLHIETWNTLQKIAGRQDFLYVADSKVCTHKQLAHIVGYGGRVVTLMPETWKEARAFKNDQRQRPKKKERILRRLLPHSENEYDTYYCIKEDHYTEKSHYPLHWIYSSEKKKRDQQSRENRLKKAETDLSDLMIRLNTKQLKTKEPIEARVKELLEKQGVECYYYTEIGEVKEQSRQQIGRGRPSKETSYKKIVTTIYTLSWTRKLSALKREKNIDGFFPILCTDPEITAKKALEAYQHQPRLEKRFYQLKSVHQGAPTLFKKVERVEAMMFLFFLALILQAAIEREVREAMSESNIKALSVYPEHRLAYHPTTAKIFDRFHELSTYKINQNGCITEEYRDELTQVQEEILKLLGMREKDYWYGIV